MNEPASEVYEIVTIETSRPQSWLRNAFVLFTNLLALGDGPINPGGMIISVVHKETGEELFRHVEDMGDDEGHLLDGIEHDLATLSAHEFHSRWA